LVSRKQEALEAVSAKIGEAGGTSTPIACHMGKMEEIEKDSVIIDSEGEERILSSVDQVIVAAGIKPCDVLTKTLEEENIPYFIIGDAKKPRRIMEATDEGAKAAWDL
ncbi:MAG: hypothetical protein JRC86_13615, partial [Deltaproteobacteria bacterium]|nr:hypothetical protein [Deltaproteobacteria bacterium]